MLSGASRLKLHWDLINLCKVVQEVLRQHCRRVFPVQFCPKSIKTTFNRIFSGVLLSSASRTILPRVLTCARLSQKYQDIIAEDFFQYNLQIHLRQHCTRKLLSQCQPRAYRHRFAGK